MPTIWNETFEIDMPLCAGRNIAEQSIKDLQHSMNVGHFTALDLTKCYLAYIQKLNPRLSAVIELNPDALAIADRLDEERRYGIVRGPLHGIPFLVKDNIATKDSMNTTAGSSMLIGANVPRDAHVVELLRQKGAVLLGHANMSEWSSMRAFHYSEGYSTRGGQSRNPYNLSKNPGGSSSGSAIAVSANMCAFSLGTETKSRVIFPADRNGIVGLRPTRGRVSCDGVIPVSRNFDTVGTFGRTVADAAAALDGISDGNRSLTNHLTDHRDLSDVTKIGSIGESVPDYGCCDWDFQSLRGYPERSQHTVVKVDFFNDLRRYLSSLVTNPCGIHGVQEVVAYNRNIASGGGFPWTHPAWPSGQDSFEKSMASGGTEDDAYRDALSHIQRMSQDNGLDRAFEYDDERDFDALLVPVQAGGGAVMQLAAQAGYPMITIPLDINPFDGIPYGTALIVKPHRDDKLIRLGSALERVLLIENRARQPPLFLNVEAENLIFIKDGTDDDDSEGDYHSDENDTYDEYGQLMS
ncbi:hypothetical protein JX266_002067 [Neoarthrinium moseri]|nr:hypothetical protein JX266_002067 [Neoarthrinium moseri]